MFFLVLRCSHRAVKVMDRTFKLPLREPRSSTALLEAIADVHSPNPIEYSHETVGGMNDQCAADVVNAVRGLEAGRRLGTVLAKSMPEMMEAIDVDAPKITAFYPAESTGGDGEFPSIQLLEKAIQLKDLDKSLDIFDRLDACEIGQDVLERFFSFVIAQEVTNFKPSPFVKYWEGDVARSDVARIKGTNVPRFLNLYEKLPKSKRSIVIDNGIALGLFDCGLLEEFDQQVRLCEQPNQALFKTLISRAKSSEDRREITEKLCNAGHSIDVGVFEALFRSIVKVDYADGARVERVEAYQLKEALVLLNEMHSLKIQPSFTILLNLLHFTDFVANLPPRRVEQFIDSIIDAGDLAQRTDNTNVESGFLKQLITCSRDHNLLTFPRAKRIYSLSLFRSLEFSTASTKEYFLAELGDVFMQLATSRDDAEFAYNFVALNRLYNSYKGGNNFALQILVLLKRFDMLTEFYTILLQSDLNRSSIVYGLRLVKAKWANSDYKVRNLLKDVTHRCIHELFMKLLEGSKWGGKGDIAEFDRNDCQLLLDVITEQHVDDSELLLTVLEIFTLTRESVDISPSLKPVLMRLTEGDKKYLRPCFVKKPTESP